MCHEAYWQGADACLNGIPLKKNPYDKGTVEAQSWELGWQIENELRG